MSRHGQIKVFQAAKLIDDSSIKETHSIFASGIDDIVDGTGYCEFNKFANIFPWQSIPSDKNLLFHYLASRLLVDRKSSPSKLRQQGRFARARATRKHHKTVGFALNKAGPITDFDIVKRAHLSPQT